MNKCGSVLFMIGKSLGLAEGNRPSTRRMILSQPG